MSGTQIGPAIGIIFGCAWCIAGASTLSPTWRTFGYCAAIVVSATLMFCVLHRSGATEKTFNGNVYGLSVIAEVFAIVVSAIALNRSHNETFVPPVIAAIVGLHFLGLWRASGTVTFVWVAIALCAVGVAGAAVSAPSRLGVTGFGSAIVLWCSVAATVGR